MADNGLIVRDYAGNNITLASKDIGAGVQAMRHQVTDGTNFLPTMDAVGRPGYVKLTDGTGTAAFDNSNTTPKVSLYGKGSSAGDTAMPSGDTFAHAVFFTQSAEAVKAGATAAANSVLQGGQFLANASLLALTTGQQGPLQCDPAGTLKVGAAVLGVPIYAAATGAATTNTATLTIPSAKMGFLDGFDLDGLGATAGSSVSVTIVGVLGGTLTYTVGVPAGATVPFAYSKRFNPPLQASATNTNLVVASATWGSGNTAATVTAYGHYV